MNARISAPVRLAETPESAHDAMAHSVGIGIETIGRNIRAATELHFSDQPNTFAELIDKLDHERMRLVFLMENAAELAARPHPDAAENAWNARNNGGMHR